MSGGYFDYSNYRLDDLADREIDVEIRDLLKDLSNLLHDEDYYMSGDYSKETYYKSLEEFRKKWFHNSRNIRLKNYIDDSIDKARKDMYNLIGVNDD